MAVFRLATDRGVSWGFGAWPIERCDATPLLPVGPRVRGIENLMEERCGAILFSFRWACEDRKLTDQDSNDTVFMNLKSSTYFKVRVSACNILGPTWEQ